MEASLFISSKLMMAPFHPLIDSSELSMPLVANGQESDSASAQELGLRIPGIVKRLIPLDNNTFWEYWWCVPGMVLLPEDVELLRKDFARVEKILTKLIWLWGGRFIGAEASCEVNSWQQVWELVSENKLNPEVVDIDFLPLTIKANEVEGNIAVAPAHWHIEFFQLEAVAGGYKLQEPKKACGCQIWTRSPFIKQLATGEATICYDLNISQPLDMTSPPWQSLLGIN